MTGLLRSFILLSVFIIPNSVPPCRALTILATGDSITEGYIGGILDPDSAYPALLEDTVCPGRSPCGVVNAGRGGGTSVDGALRFARDMQGAHPDITVIFFGRNDMLVEPDGNPRITPENFREAIRFMVRESKARGATPVLVAPPPVLPDRYYEHHDRELYEAVGGVEVLLAEYVGEVRRIAEEEDAALADLMPLFADSLETLLGSDGSHPSSAGHRVMADELARLVGELDPGSEPGEPERGRGGIEDCYAYPNPYRPAGGALLSIHVRIVEAGAVGMKIFDVSGRLVGTVDEVTIDNPGEHWFVWDGGAEAGGELAPGVYLVRLDWVSIEGGGREGTTIKVAMLR